MNQIVEMNVSTPEQFIRAIRLSQNVFGNQTVINVANSRERIVLTACAPKTESVELVYKFAPTREYPTIEEYVNHLNEDCDDLPYYMIDDNDYAHMMDKSEYDD